MSDVEVLEIESPLPQLQSAFMVALHTIGRETNLLRVSQLMAGLYEDNEPVFRAASKLFFGGWIVGNASKLKIGEWSSDPEHPKSLRLSRMVSSGAKYATAVYQNAEGGES